MPMVAIIIDRFSERVNLREALIGYEPWWKQIVFGSFVGIVIAILAKLLVESPLLDEVNAKYAHMLGRFKLNMSEIVLVSLCAGVGEEILFRGALQPIFGIIITSIIFVAIHGYLNPRDWRLSIYGVYMVGAIAVIGWMSERLGLISAILAHTIIDIYLLHHLQNDDDEVTITENPNLQDPFQDL